MPLLQRLDGVSAGFERADAFEAGAGGAEGGHDWDAAAAGGAADLHFVFASGFAARGVDDEGEFAVLQHVESVGAAFAELVELLNRDAGFLEHGGGAAR